MSLIICEKCHILKDEAEFSIKWNGSHNKHCDLCISIMRLKCLCPHGKYRTNCVRCSGCHHGRRRIQCKECNFKKYMEQLVRVHNKRVCRNYQNYMENLGCSIDDLIDWIECDFTQDMTWANHGSLWEIDHTLPLNEMNINYVEKVKRLHFTNLRAVYKTQNRPGRYLHL